MTQDDQHKYFDMHRNKYDNKLYPGNITEKVMFKHHGKSINYTRNRFFKLYQCNYCYENFVNKNRLFRHLGYCDVDIRPEEVKNQTKITQYFPGKYQKMCQLRIQKQEQEKCLKSDMTCPKIDYEADVEEEDEVWQEDNIDKDIGKIIKLVKNMNTDNVCKNKNNCILKSRNSKIMKKKVNKSDELTKLIGNIKI